MKIGIFLHILPQKQVVCVRRSEPKLKKWHFGFTKTQVLMNPSPGKCVLGSLTVSGQQNLLTKINSLLAGFCFETTRHSKQTGVKSGLCFSINGFMLLGKPPSLVRSKCAGTCSGQLFWPVSCFCLQLLFSGCSCIRCNLWVPDGS